MRQIYLAVIITLFTLTGYAQSTNNDYYSDRLILKVKDDFRGLCENDAINHAEISKVISDLGEATLLKMFPHHKAPRIKYDDERGTDLSLVYELKYNSDIDPTDLIPYFSKTNLFEYVEVLPVIRALSTYVPNDPDINLQWHLETIKAFGAWDVSKGDTNVVVGIVDTGTKLDHPDLADNVSLNYNDPINGSDNDGNGLIDDFNGWDFGDGDNDPNYQGNDHGVLVGGLASAVPDNTTQGAGTGFNVRFLPVKVMSSSGSLATAFQGIVYAADKGCAVINCSFGSTTSSQFGQDVINYATLVKDALVVCSAGNNNNEGLFYPASYDWALSVGGTHDETDKRWITNSSFGSNYNYRVDICAPAFGVYTTNGNGTSSGGKRGTSMSAPIVAGAAALLKSFDPTLSAIQLGAQLKATADLIDTVPENASYVDKLGHGRLNMERSVTDFTKPGFEYTGITHTDNDDDWYTPGDTVNLGGKVQNYLAASSSSAKVMLTSESPHVTILNEEITMGEIPNFNEFNLTNNPFLIRVEPGTPTNYTADFVIWMIDGDYVAKRPLKVLLNIDYLNYENNNIATTITSKGNTAFNDGGNQNQGIGVKHNDEDNIMFQMGFMIGNSDSTISFSLANEFAEEEAIEVRNPGIESELDYLSRFNDSNSSSEVGVDVIQRTLSWNSNERSDFILFEYTIKNNSPEPLENIHLGLYADWDVTQSGQNTANFDEENRIAYCAHASGKHAGFHLVNDTNYHHYAFETQGTNGSFNLTDGFTKTEQFTSISSGNLRPSSQATTDVAHSIGAGPYNIGVGDSVRVAFSMIVGDSFEEIQNSALASDTAYDEIRSVELLVDQQNDASCFDDCDGAVSVMVNKGIAPYTFEWSNADIGSNINNLCQGEYLCYVEDQVGNKDTLVVQISEPNQIQNTFSDLIQDNGNCEGGATANVIGGTLPYTFFWDQGSSGSATTSDLCTGEIILNVTDSNGCVLVDTVEISIITSLEGDLYNETLIYPNPTSSYLTIEFTSSEWEVIEVRNVLGNLILRKEVNANKFNIQTSSWANGVYFLSLRNGQQIVNKSITKTTN